MNGRGARQFYRGGGAGAGGNNNNNSQAFSRDLDELTRNFQGQKNDVEQLKNMFFKVLGELERLDDRVKELEANQTNPTTHNYNDPDNLKQQQTTKLNNPPKNTQNDPQLNNNNHHHQQHKPERRPKIRRASQQTHNKNQLRNNQQEQPTNFANNNGTGHRPKQADANHNNDQHIENNLKYLDSNQSQQQQSSDFVKNQDPQQTQHNIEVSNKNQERPPRLKKNSKNFHRKPYRKTKNFNNNNDNQQQNQDQQQHKDYPELNDAEMNEIVQNLKREFFIEPNNLFKRSMREIRNIINDKGPKVIFEFVCSILDHALCDVTSPTKLNKIAIRFYQLLVCEDYGFDPDFIQGFYEALADISRREDDIAIDAPRYMDTLGQVLAECIIPMNKNKHRHLIKEFLKGCLDSYCEKNRAVLLASIMVSIAGLMGDRFARAVWDASELDWKNVIVGIGLEEFMADHDVAFTTKKFSPRSSITDRKDPREMEKFADEVTSLTERRCSPQTLVEMVKELNLEQNEKIDYLGTFIYAIVRGCLDTNSGDYKLNNEALNKYSSILNTKNEEQEAIALCALTALTKLWHHYNCPQDLLRTILVSLYNHGTAPYSSLNEWLNSESLTNIPGIGAARLNSKRYIEDLGANLKQSSS